MHVEDGEGGEGWRAQDGGCEQRREDGYVAEGGQRVRVAERGVGLRYSATLRGK